MDKPRSAAAPICIALLLFLILYVGSYLAVVVPQGHLVIGRVTTRGAFASREHYRWGAHHIKYAYWPLEQIDRKVRPQAWEFRTQIAPAL